MMALLSLAIGSFGIGMTEFVVMGLLPNIGAFLGGVVIAAGWGFLASTWVGVALALAGLALAFVSLSVERSRIAVPTEVTA